MLRKIFILCSLLLFLVIFFNIKLFFSPRPHDIAKEVSFVVRIRIIHDAPEVRVSSSSKCDIYNRITGKILKNGVRRTKIKVSGKGIDVEGDVFSGGAVSIYGESDIEVNGIGYRGEFDVIRTKKGLDVVNKVQLEDYLKGVLPREVYVYWPLEALKAQAIASRSFAVNEVLRQKSKEYDMTADTFSQVYGGMSAETKRTNKAVDDTRGRVLEYDGEVLAGYFHSCCGGHTEDISILWGSDVEPLKGVKCRWCRWSPFFRWKAKVKTKTILEKLKKKEFLINRIDDIRVKDIDDSGRPEYVTIRSRRKWFDMKVREFRGFIGRSVLKSARFRIKKYPRFYLFKGYGWGHGVGMCQWGAFGLSLRRWSAERILEFYYPGAKIENISKILCLV